MYVEFVFRDIRNSNRYNKHNEKGYNEKNQKV